MAAQRFRMTLRSPRRIRDGVPRSSRIATLKMLHRKTLVCKHGVENDLDISRKPGGPAIQPEPLEADMILDGRSPALCQAQFWVGPL